MRILITGSRTWTDNAAVRLALVDATSRRRTDDLTVVHGACPDSPDMVADRWTVHISNAFAEPHPADWDTHGKAAGFRRNQRMVDLGADLCLAFIARCVKPICARKPIHGSHGATDCARRAAIAGIPTIEYLRWGQP